MKHPLCRFRGLLLAACVLAGTATLAVAAPPEAVLTQLRADVSSAMAGTGLPPAPAQVDQIVAGMQKEMGPGLTPFEFTPEEAAAFEAGTTTVTDADLEKAFAEMRQIVVGRPLPHLLTFYDTRRAAGQLTPRQKILCHRLSTSVLAMLKKMQAAQGK